MNTVLTESYKEPQFNRKEILRYAGCREETDEVSKMLDECISECTGRLTYKVCYGEFPVELSEKSVDFSFMKAESKALAKNFSGCRASIVFAATVGIEMDRLIAKYGRISPAKGLIFQAIGAERIESLCDAFNKDIKMRLSERGLFARPRFSPGYGDFPLNAQTDIFRVLDCPRKIGLSLNESLLMSPSKSVTAVIGVSEFNSGCGNVPCEQCAKKDCAFRR